MIGHLKSFRNKCKKKSRTRQTQRRDGQAGRRAREELFWRLFTTFLWLRPPFTLPYSSLQDTGVSLGRDRNEWNICPPFAQILFLTRSEMKLKMSKVGHRHKNIVHNLLLSLLGKWKILWHIHEVNNPSLRAKMKSTAACSSLVKWVHFKLFPAWAAARGGKGK